MDTVVILHNIRSIHNVGSVFRTADGAGVSRIFLTGYTPAPIDRFGRPSEGMEKTALGATSSIPWEQCDDIFECINSLKNKGYMIVAVEQTSHAKDYRIFSPQRNTAFIFGNEVDGVPDAVCVLSDEVIHIPMYGVKESLNISVSAGVVLFRFAPQADA